MKLKLLQQSYIILGMLFASVVLFSATTPPGTDHKTNVPVNPRTIAEYDSVAAVVMYWNPGNNPAYDQIVTAVVNGIQPRATVFMQTNSDFHQNNMISTFMSHGVPIENIVFIPVAGYRIWIRDHGPFSIYDDDELAFLGFNDLATNHGDQDLPYRLAQHWDINYYDFMHIIFDGGNYLVDQHNRLFATDRLYSNNPSIPPNHIDTILEHFMGIEEIYTLSALSNDYWGHLDMQVKLLNDTSFIISTVDSWHSDYQILQDNYSILQDIEHPEGKSYEIVQIPKAQNWKTYINSLIVNDAILVPIYNDPNDAFALDAYQALSPDKTIIGIDCNAMIQWEGAIHCITNQLPPFEAVETDEKFMTTFVITDEHGNTIEEAVVMLGDTENAPGQYVFDDLEPGTYSFVITDDCFTDVSGEISITDTDLVVEVEMHGLTGDANGDGLVNVLDLIVVAQYFLDQHTDLFCFANADVNQDGIVNVIDAIGIVNIFTSDDRGPALTNVRTLPADQVGMAAYENIENSFQIRQTEGSAVVNIAFEADRKAPFTIDILKGSEVIRTVHIPAWFKGEYITPLDMDSLTPGDYTIRLGTGSLSWEKPLRVE